MAPTSKSSRFRVQNSERGSVVGRGGDPADRGAQYPTSNIQYPIAGGMDRRRGVALIIVLGFLTIMVLMAVAFLTQARTERMVSDSTLEAMRGRQLLRTAVNAAMNDYSTYLWAEQIIVPADPAERMFVSRPPSSAAGMNGRTVGADNVSLLVGEVLDWIPRGYLDPPFDAVSEVDAQAQWILIRENPNNPQSRILGRYAYVCFDSSGGLDANLIARSEGVAAQDVRGFTNRFRRSVRDVPMGNLKETVDANEFKRLRKGWKGFDSLQSVIKLTDGHYIDGQTDFESGDAPAPGKLPSNVRWRDDRIETKRALDPSNVNSLVSYSLSAYRGGRYDRVSGRWTEPKPMNESTDWESLLAPLNYQLAHGWGSWINKAIYDYTHPTQVPQGTDYPSPKNVPMFNEIAVNYELVPPSGAVADYQLRLNLAMEFWYPFPSRDNDNAGTYSFQAPSVGCGSTPTGPGDIYVQLILMDPGPPMTVYPIAPALNTATPAPLSVDAKWNGGIPYRPTPDRISIDIPLTSPVGPLPAPPANLTMTIRGTLLQQPVYLTGPGGKADMLPGGGATPMSFEGVVNLPVGTPSPTNSYAVTDPRMNHERGQWVQESPPSLGQMNNWFTAPVMLKSAGMMSDTALREEGMCMYSRNGPMESPAEIGFISNGKEWGSIDLCTREGVELLATLVSTNLYGEWLLNDRVIYTNGTINPHTRSEDALVAAFYDLPANEVPGQESDNFSPVATYPGKTINEELAKTLAEKILFESDMSSVATGERLARSFQFGSDWARVEAMQKRKDLAMLGLNNNQRESLIRNTWGLFSPENSMFTVVAIAQAIKESPGNVGIWNEKEDMVTGERRAVALIWRDPFKTGQNLHHEMFVRMYRYLND